MSSVGTFSAPVTQPPRLLDQLKQKALARFGRAEPGERYVAWARRFILFHGKRHPRELGMDAVGQFLEHVAQSEKDPLRGLEQAREALEFLYVDLLHINLGELPFPEPPRLIDRLRHALRVGHHAPTTEACYVNWVVRFIRFHGMRHPNTMGAAEIEMFLTDLAVRGHVAANTQNQAFHALLFLYQQVLGIELPRLDAVRAKRPKRLPTVLSAEEVRQLLDAVRGGDGVFRLMAGLLYGAGLRREECCRLRVHDVDLGRQQIIVRHGKGAKDRVVMLPKSLRPEFERQLAWRRDLHERDVRKGVARVALPDALARKFPRAAQELGWHSELDINH
jgi:integrase